MKTTTTLITACCALSILAGCGTAPQTTESAAPVVTAVATSGQIPDTLALTGTLTAKSEVEASAKSAGRLTELTVEVGSRVSAGQLIGRLDAANEAAMASSIRANLTAAEHNLTTLKKLYDERIRAAEIGIQLTQKSAGDVDSLSSTQLETAKADLQREITSAITASAITAQTTVDTLDQLLGVSDKNQSLNDSFERHLGTLDASAKTAAEAALRTALASHATFRTAFNADILSGTPGAEVLDRDTLLCLTALEDSKKALEKSSVMLLKSTSGGELTATALQGYQTTLTTLGGQVETNLATLKRLYGNAGLTSQIAVLEKQIAKTSTDTTSSVTTAELNLATLKKERDAKIAEAESLITTLLGQAGISGAALDAAIIRAPTTGVIVAKYVERGTVVNPGQPIVRIADDSSLTLVVAVPDNVIGAFGLGRVADITVDSIPGATFHARITKVAPVADSGAKKATVELTLESAKNLKPGLFARATFALSAEHGVVVPAAAIISRYGENFVYIVEEQHAVERSVTLGAETDTSTIITTGVQPGEIVITKGHRFLRDGDAIRITQ